MHISLIQILAEDANGYQITLLSDIYRRSMALCRELPKLSDQTRRRAQIKPSFWLGKLHFVYPYLSKLKDPINIWEKTTECFLRGPTMGGVEIMLPVTHFFAQLTCEICWRRQWQKTQIAYSKKSRLYTSWLVSRRIC
jgi:hypothetical protein